MRAAGRSFAALLVLLAAPLGPAVSQEPPREVRSLAFEGNQAIDDYTLSAVIATTQSSFFARWWLVRWMGLGDKRQFDELEFRRDVVRLLLFYRQNGFMEAAVDTVVERRPRSVRVRVIIYEGRPVRVTALLVSGVAGVLDSAALVADLPLRVGDPFNRYLMQASVDTIVSRLRVRGFPYAEVFRNFDLSEEARQAVVQFEAVSGPRSRIEAIDIRGTREIDPSVVRRMLSVRPGDVFNLDRIYQSQRDLYRTDVFRYASVSLGDSAPSGPGDTLVRLNVVVSEGQRHRIRIGAGYGSIDCFRSQVGWTARNFLGGARALDVSGRVAKLGVGKPTHAGLEHNLCRELVDDFTAAQVSYNVTVSLRQPWFFSPRNTASWSLFAERRSEVKAYIREAVGGNFALTRETRHEVPVTLSYNLSYGRTTTDNPARYCAFFVVCDTADQRFLAERRVLASVALSATRVRTNNPLNPTRGTAVTLDLQHISRAIGSDADFEFNKGVLEVAGYLPVGRRSTLALRFRGGAILPPAVTLRGQNLGFVPPDQRFYAGGPTTVRGYRRNEMGPLVYVVTAPTDTTPVAVPTGGNTLVVANAELRLPSPILPSRLQLGVFVDAGQLYERGDTLFTFSGFRVTPGVGIRIGTPLGPIRFDAAYNPYDYERGPVVFLDDQNGTFTQLPREHQAVRGRSFKSRLIVQFAVGQAF